MRRLEDIGKEKKGRRKFQRPSSIRGPHRGQSSQLVFDANDGNAQFLPTHDIGVNRPIDQPTLASARLCP